MMPVFVVRLTDYSPVWMGGFGVSLSDFDEINSISELLAAYAVVAARRWSKYVQESSTPSEAVYEIVFVGIRDG